MQNYHTRIRELREDNDETQASVASILKVSQSNYSKYERGERKLTLEQLHILCKHFNVSADYILGLPKNLSWPR